MNLANWILVGVLVCFSPIGRFLAGWPFSVLIDKIGWGYVFLALSVGCTQSGNHWANRIFPHQEHEEEINVANSCDYSIKLLVDIISLIPRLP